MIFFIQKMFTALFIWSKSDFTVSFLSVSLCPHCHAAWPSVPKPRLRVSAIKMEAGNKENGKRDINRKALQFTEGTASRAGYDICRPPFKTQRRTRINLPSAMRKINTRWGKNRLEDRFSESRPRWDLQQSERMTKMPSDGQPAERSATRSITLSHRIETGHVYHRSRHKNRMKNGRKGNI